MLKKRILKYYLGLLLICAFITLSITLLMPVSSFNTQYLNNTVLVKGISFDTIKWSFRSGYYGQWQPLAWISHAIDFTVFGEDLALHRVSGVILHLLTATIFFIFLIKVTSDGMRALVATTVFALHPIQLETLIDPTLRGVLVGAPLALLTMLIYQAATKKNSVTKYLIMLILFVVTLMASAAFVVLPFILILIDIWPLSRFKRHGVSAVKYQGRGWIPLEGLSIYDLFIEKLPFFAIFVVSTFFSNLIDLAWRHSAHIEIQSTFYNLLDTFGWCLLYFARSWGPLVTSSYAIKTTTLPIWLNLIAMFFVFAISYFVSVRFWRAPYLFFGWFSFLLFLLPFMPILRCAGGVGADGIMYTAMLPFSIVLTWSVFNLAQKNIK